jgi:uncharacterized protein (TIGR02246 family)
MKRFVVIIVALAYLALGDVATSMARSSGAESLLDGFVQAWNSHDGKAFDHLFTDDAVWVAVAEARTQGRTAIVNEFSEIHATWAKETTIVASDIEVHSVREDVAIVLFHGRYLDHSGQRVAGVDRAILLVAVKTKDGWRIAAGQLTKQSPPTP